jgi:hypothetical protein
MLRSVARTRLVETENHSACATVEYKVCKPATALYLNAIERDCNQGANKSKHPNWNPSFSSRVPPYTWQCVKPPSTFSFYVRNFVHPSSIFITSIRWKNSWHWKIVSTVLFLSLCMCIFDRNDAWLSHILLHPGITHRDVSQWF